jgi:tRNA U34 5-carboxymethylaminomethyl modifying GTPase MnmE/TrmE
MSDTFNMSGDFRGAILNIKSNLKHVQQSVGDIKTQDLDARAELQALIEKLSQELEKSPPEQKEQVEAVAQTAQALVEQAKAEKPNKTMLQITGEGLKQAAKNLAEVAPAVGMIAGQIVLAVGRVVSGM